MRANSIAIARPIPRDAPVTRATRRKADDEEELIGLMIRSIRRKQCLRRVASLEFSPAFQRRETRCDVRVAQRRLKRIGIQASLRDADTARIFPALKRRANLNRR